MLLNKVYKEAINLPSLSPSKRTNRVFSNLVAVCCDPKEAKHSLKKSDVVAIQQCSAQAEIEMELFWSSKIINAKKPAKTLLSFWYFKNYQALTNLEIATACLYKKIKTAVFVGGGPLPLTVILLAKKGIHCTVIEKDGIYAEQARKVISSLKLKRCITIVTDDGMTFPDYKRFDLIYVSALAGLQNKEKEKLIHTTYAQARRTSLILLRTSYGKRTLLYPSIDPMLLRDKNILLEVKPHNDIINSFFILQKT